MQAMHQMSLSSRGNASNVTAFSRALSSLLKNLSNRAAAGGPLRTYAADNTTVPDVFRNIYALVQCTPDLSQQDCSDCLTTAISRVGSFCDGITGCRILQPRNGNNTTRTIIISVVASLVGILLLVPCIWMSSRRRKPKETVEIETADEIIKVESLPYDCATVRAATNNFCDENKLGEGGFGVVYKGRLLDGQDVAVKRLSSGSGQGDLEYENDVLLVAKRQHRNLVKLLGFCLEGDKRLLTYEYLPNTSLIISYLIQSAVRS
ncbi:hypothetical protein SLE2022_014910 [Rubroshorea leprosula]